MEPVDAKSVSVDLIAPAVHTTKTERLSQKTFAHEDTKFNLQFYLLRDFLPQWKIVLIQTASFLNTKTIKKCKRNIIT